MKKVLIISRWFPPLNMIASKRFGTMCKYFEEYGYMPYILTAKPQIVNISGFKMDLEVPVDESRIIRIGRMGTEYAPVSILAKGTARLLEYAHIHSNTLSGAVLGRYEKEKKGIDIPDLGDVDIIIGTFPEMDSLFMAGYLSRKLKCPYIVDIRDLFEFVDMVPEGWKHGLKLDLFMERLVFHRAAAIVPVTPGYKRILKKRYPGKKIEVVFNGWEEKEKEYHGGCRRKYLYYAGSLYEHRLESLNLLMQCMKEVNRSEDIKLFIRSTGPQKHDRKMKQMIRRMGMEEYVRVFDAAKEDVIKREQADAYINVVLSTVHGDDKVLTTTVPGKVYEVLYEKPPVLAVVPEHSDVSELLKITNKGIGTTSRRSIVDFILAGNRQYKGNGKIEFFSRKRQAQRYCVLMDEILESGAGRRDAKRNKSSKL